MLNSEENQLLTQIGPGAPCGELLRRYWQPVALARELTDERSKRRVKILGEELVLYRVAEGPEAREQVTGAGQDQLPPPDPRSPTPVRYGLVGEHCSHRGASLYYGFIEDGCIRCPYHGWLYDQGGHCLEQPFEPAQSFMKHTIRHPAYPVEELAGLLFTYMGPPERKPLLPRWDVLVWEGGQRVLRRQQTLDCRWLQAEENSADVTHTYFLHGHSMRVRGLRGGEYYHRPVEQYGFQPFEWGLLKSWRYSAGDVAWLPAERGGGNPLIFPNMLRVREGVYHSLHWRVPIDDEHTEIFHASFLRQEDLRNAWAADVDRHEEGWTALKDPDGEYTMTSFPSQDTMAWETQGPLFDRSRERLGASDTGIVLFRQMLKEQIEIVQRGGDPMALVYEPECNHLIEIPDWVVEGEVVVGGTAAPVRRSMEGVFNGQQYLVEVPFGTARPRRE